MTVFEGHALIWPTIVGQAVTTTALLRSLHRKINGHLADRKPAE